jgi:hypothetical protein
VFDPLLSNRQTINYSFLILLARGFSIEVYRNGIIDKTKKSEVK